MSNAGGGFVLLPGEGRQIGLGSFAVTVKASREQTGGAFTLIETEEAVLGAGPPLHVSVIAERYDMEILGPPPEGYL